MTKKVAQQRRFQVFKKDGTLYRLLGTMFEGPVRKLCVIPMEGDPMSQRVPMDWISENDFISERK